MVAPIEDDPDQFVCTSRDPDHIAQYHPAPVSESYWSEDGFELICCRCLVPCEPGTDGKWFCIGEQRHEIVDRVHVSLAES